MHILLLLISFVILITFSIIKCSKEKNAKSRAGEVLKNDSPSTALRRTDNSKAEQVRDNGSSIRTTVNKGGSNEDDDVFKELKLKLAQNNNEKSDSFLDEDELNPLANYVIPERPTVNLKDTPKAPLSNIVQMELVSKKKKKDLTTQTTQDENEVKSVLKPGVPELRLDKTQPEITPSLKGKDLGRTQDVTGDEDENRKTLLVDLNKKKSVKTGRNTPRMDKKDASKHLKTADFSKETSKATSKKDRRTATIMKTVVFSKEKVK